MYNSAQISKTKFFVKARIVRAIISQKNRGIKNNYIENKTVQDVNKRKKKKKYSQILIPKLPQNYNSITKLDGVGPIDNRPSTD